MTTFTTEDRIFAEKDGSFTINVEGGTVTSSPPHIVDSGASIMIKDLTDEEIRDISINFLGPKEGNIFTFARAILRKAQEK
jgi:hypothetical protein